MKIGINDINKLYYGTNEVGQLASSGVSVTFYTPSPVQQCPEVTDDISTYEGEAQYVYDTTQQQWFVRNDNGGYTARALIWVDDISNADTFEGRLLLNRTNGHEYIYTNGEWNDLGEKFELLDSCSYLTFDNTHMAKFPLGVTADTDTVIEFSGYAINQNGGGRIIGDEYSQGHDQDDTRMFAYQNKWFFDRPGTERNGERISGCTATTDTTTIFGNFYIQQGATKVTGTTRTFQGQSELSLGGLTTGDTFVFRSIRIYNGTTNVKQYYPAFSGGNACLYESVGGEYVDTLNGIYPASGGSQTTIQIPVADVVEYDEMDAPPASIEFSSLEEMEAYECPYEGLEGVVDGVTYVYTNGAWTIKPVPQNIVRGTLVNGTSSFTFKINNSDVTATVYQEDGKTKFEYEWTGGTITTLANAFSGKTALVSIDEWSLPTDDMPKTSATTQFMFDSCRNLIEPFWLPGMTVPGKKYICKCSGLTATTLVIPPTITATSEGCYAHLKSITNIVLPPTLATLELNALIGNSHVTSYDIPATVTDIKQGAMAECTLLEEVTVRNPVPPSLTSASSVFSSSPALRRIYVPAESVNAYKSASGWSSYSAYIMAIP